MVGPLKDNDGIVITKSKEMADSLNIYFSSVFTLEDKNNLPVQQPLLADNVECLTHMLITPAMIVTKIKKLKDNKSPVSLRLSLRLRARRLYRPKPS